MAFNVNLEASVALSLIAAGAYFGAASMLWKKISLRRGQRGFGEWSNPLWVFAMTLHAIALFSLLHSNQGLDMAFFKSASLLTLIIAFFLYLSCLRNPLEILAFIILPITALLLLIASFSGNQRIVNASGPGVQAHIVLSLLAYSLLSIAALQALMLAWQGQQLRHNPSHFLIAHLPPLEAMESFLFTLINSGFILLSASLLSGWLYHDDLLAQHLAHKTVFSLIAWLSFAVLVGGRLLRNWRGAWVLRLTISGIVFLILAYFGSKLVLEYILHRV